MRGHSNLIRVDMSWNHVPPANSKYFFNALKENSKLQGLAFELNEFADEGAEALAELLATEHSGLEQLFVGANQMTSKGIASIAKALGRNTKLQMLDLGRNDIGQDGAKALAEMLRENKALTTLYLPATDILNNGLEAIVKAVEESNKQLTDLDVSYMDDLNKKLVDKLKQLTERNRVALDSDL